MTRPAGRPVEDGQPALGRMLLRGIVRRCPRCGSGSIFDSWFRLGDRCPGCRLRLEREHDFFLGGYVINLAVTEGLLALALLIYVLRISADPGTSLVPVLVAGVSISVVLPVLFFPFSRTIWMAIDLAMRPAPRHEDDTDDQSTPGGQD